MSETSFKVDGMKETIRSLDAIIDARDAQSIYKNFSTVTRFLLREVKSKTPGKGDLAKAWTLKTNIRKRKQGARYTATIFNELQNKTVYYTSAYDGKRRIKRNKDDKPQKWKEVIFMLDKGTKAHRIAPRRYKALIFNVANVFAVKDSAGRLRSTKKGQKGRFTKSTETVFAGSVLHPGTKAYGMITDTENMLQRAIDSFAVDMGEGIITTWESKTGAGPKLRAINVKALRK